MADEPSIPPVSMALIAELERIFPNTVPAPDARTRHVWISVGKQEVIAKLRQWYKQQSAEGAIARS